MGRNNESTSINYKDLVLEYLYTYYDKDAIDYLRTITHMYGINVENLIEENADKFERRAKTEEKSFNTYLVKQLSNKEH